MFFILVIIWIVIRLLQGDDRKERFLNRIIRKVSTPCKWFPRAELMQIKNTEI